MAHSTGTGQTRGDVEIVHVHVEAGVDVNVKGSTITPVVAAIEGET